MYIFSIIRKIRILYNSQNKVSKIIKGVNNQISYPKVNINLQLTINGNNNSLIVSKKSILRNVRIIIIGNNNTIYLGDDVKFNKKGLIWIEDNYTTLNIGKCATFEDTSFAITENNSKIEIGDDCMFAYDIEIKTGDSHSIIDISTGKRINFAKDVIIGNHVWVAAHSVLLKGTKINDNSIVASNTVVTKPFNEKNAIIAGNPAKIIKEGVNWDRARFNE
jgi:acetyltransferase-like isoleucine patch superfamily enzyme